MKARSSIIALVAITTASCIAGARSSTDTALAPEALSNQWEYVGQVINEPGWDVWGSSPMVDEDGRVHLFCARWPGKINFNRAWRYDSQIAHYVADNPEGPFEFVEVVLEGNHDDTWDAYGYHNPNIKRIGDKYALTYIANTGPKAKVKHPKNQAIGLLVADSLDGPWLPANGDIDTPALAAPTDKSHWCYNSRNGVANPALVELPDGRIAMYVKVKPFDEKGKPLTPTMTVAIADTLAGPFVFADGPITANDSVIEDGYAFIWRNHVCLMTTDNHGILENGGGLIWYSKDGFTFESKPLSGFHNWGKFYMPDGIPKTAVGHYNKKVKFERPQILMQDGEPAYLYVPSGTAVDGSDGTNCHVLRRKTSE